MASKCYGVNATIIIFVFVLYVLYVSTNEVKPKYNYLMGCNIAKLNVKH